MRKKINFSVANLGHSHEIIDAVYAYYQSQAPDYQSHVDFVMSNEWTAESDLNIHLDYMPTQRSDLDAFDAAFYSNGCEPLCVSTEIIRKELELPNRFLVCNSLLTHDHPWKDRVIWFPANILACRDLWSRYFFPHFFDNHRLGLAHEPRRPMIFVNGQNRSWRHHFSLSLASICPEIPQHSRISDWIHETNDSFFESEEDQHFREYVNDAYKDIIKRNQDSYYNEYISCGIDSKFGQYPVVYNIFSIFYQYDCVIFPESSWQNDELPITEKALKCFYSGVLPWPVGGSNINSLYKKIGFSTVWDLLPDDLREFDSEKDHLVRYQKLCTAIRWVWEHPFILKTARARELVRSNKEKFLTCFPCVDGVIEFDKILQNLLIDR